MGLKKRQAFPVEMVSFWGLNVLNENFWGGRSSKSIPVLFWVHLMVSNPSNIVKLDHLSRVENNKSLSCHHLVVIIIVFQRCQAVPAGSVHFLHPKPHLPSWRPFATKGWGCHTLEFLKEWNSTWFCKRSIRLQILEDFLLGMLNFRRLPHFELRTLFFHRDICNTYLAITWPWTTPAGVESESSAFTF